MAKKKENAKETEVKKEKKVKEVQAETVSRTERKRAEKTARRDAKAARKQANIVEEKKSKISNGVLAIMIFGVLIAMFASVWGYNYFSKEASIETYLKNNGGEEQYSAIPIDETKTATVAAKGNDMTITINVNAEKDEDIKTQTEYYKGDIGGDELEYYGAYFLNIIKPNVRGFKATATCTVKVADKKIATRNVDYKDVEDILSKYGISTTQDQ